MHCEGGYSRSVSIVLGYLIMHRRFELQDAIALCARGRRIGPRSNFLQALAVLEGRVLGKKSEGGAHGKKSEGRAHGKRSRRHIPESDVDE